MMLVILNKPKIDIKNLEIMSAILFENIHQKSLNNRLLNSSLKVMDFIIENSIEMLEEDERNQVDIAHDISYDQRKKLTMRMIAKLTKFGREVVRTSLDNRIDMTHSETYSTQLSIYTPNSTLAESKQNLKLIKVQNPFMDNTSLRKGSYFFVKLNPKITESKTMVLWSYSHETFKKPKNVHWVANLLWIGSYDSTFRYNEINDTVNVKIPLRVMLPDVSLKKHFKCAKVEIRETSEKIKLYNIASLDEDNNDVECNFKSVSEKDL